MKKPAALSAQPAAGWCVIAIWYKPEEVALRWREGGNRDDIRVCKYQKLIAMAEETHAEAELACA